MYARGVFSNVLRNLSRINDLLKMNLGRNLNSEAQGVSGSNL